MSFPASRLNMITLQMSVPLDQVDSFKSVVRQWMHMVPTVYFLDICAIGHIKDYLQAKSFKDDKHERSIRTLQELDLRHNNVSYLPALMEKASDQRSKLSADEFVAEARRDWDAMGVFFESANVFEPWSFVESYANELFGAHPEQSVPAYLEFLQFANDQGLSDPPAKSKRLKLAKNLCAKARELGISTSHPVVLVPVACVYGCKDAIGVMKFRKKPEDFNPGNALGDIQSITRVAGTLTDLIQRAGASGGPFKNGTFKASDSALHNMLRYFKVQSVVTTEVPDGATHRFMVTVDAPGLYPELFDVDRKPKDDKSHMELNDLYALLGAELPEYCLPLGTDPGGGTSVT